MMASLQIDQRAAMAVTRAGIQRQSAVIGMRRDEIATRQNGADARRKQIAQKNQLNEDRRNDILKRTSGYEKNQADVDENLRGTREIVDTRTGERGTADLGYSGEIVDSLNHYTADPGRFQERPLRDQ